MNVSIIVAMSKNRVIGKDNGMPWHLSDDLKNFKKITINKTIIMGRLTYDSIGKPLPERNNIILSRSLKDQKVIVLDNLEEALNISRNEEEVFIIGGADLYSQTINLANKLYLTSINHEISGDKYFPEFDEEEWDIIHSQSYEKNDSNSHDFKSEILVKKS
ncbi:type 3 dihydrofolate reductase [Gammaproteobacteria bacterium]|nr:type 3 dihydrofolate reductase [Gammaproteobacteria bacterium]